jgi:hypothetical protein
VKVKPVPLSQLLLSHYPRAIHDGSVATPQIADGSSLVCNAKKAMPAAYRTHGETNVAPFVATEEVLTGREDQFAPFAFPENNPKNNVHVGVRVFIKPSDHHRGGNAA